MMQHSALFEEIFLLACFIYISIMAIG